MSNKLILDPSGSGGCTPNEDPWEPEGGREVTITNNSGYDQTLANITPGLLTPAPGNSITVSTTANWVGRVGTSRGTYVYNDGSPGTGPRTGTIDPS